MARRRYRGDDQGRSFHVPVLQLLVIETRVECFEAVGDFEVSFGRGDGQEVL
jgi:hypothetical protein